MNGLLSSHPSPSAIRLAVGGFLLLFVQTFILMLAPGVAADLRAMMWIVTLVSGASLIGALVGMPEPPTDQWRRRRGR